MSIPPGTEMFQFPGFASASYVFRYGYPLLGGLPHSDIHGSTPARGSPWLFAACHVLHRLLVPRHPPNALLALEISRPALTGEPALRHAQEPSSGAVVSNQRSGGLPDTDIRHRTRRMTAHDQAFAQHTTLTPLNPTAALGLPPVRHGLRHAQRRTRT